MNPTHFSGSRLFPRPGRAAIRAGAWVTGGVALLFSLAACKSAGRAGGPGTQTSQWLYVSLKITRHTGGGFAFSVLNQVRAGAMPAAREGGSREKRDGETLVFAFYNAREKWSHTRYVANPLYREVEFFGEDGTVGRKKLSLPEATFTVGTPRAGDVTHLVIRNRNHRELGRFLLGRP